MGIEPDGVKPGVQPAPDVGGQTVPYHRRFLRMKVRDSGEAGVEKRFGGLVGAKLLRDKDAFEIRADSGGVQPGILYGGSAGPCSQRDTACRETSKYDANSS